MKLPAIKAERLERAFVLFFFLKTHPVVIYLFSRCLISKKRDLCLVAWLPELHIFLFMTVLLCCTGSCQCRDIFLWTYFGSVGVLLHPAPIPEKSASMIP